MVSAPAPPFRALLPGIACEDVGQGIAGRVDVRCPGQRDVLDARLVRARCGKGHGGVDEIRPCIRGELNDHVAGAIDGVGVVAHAAGHAYRRRCRH